MEKYSDHFDVYLLIPLLALWKLNDGFGCNPSLDKKVLALPRAAQVLTPQTQPLENSHGLCRQTLVGYPTRPLRQLLTW
jgi:hypothetical protein